LFNFQGARFTRSLSHYLLHLLRAAFLFYHIPLPLVNGFFIFLSLLSPFVYTDPGVPENTCQHAA